MDGYALRARDTRGATRAHPRTLTKVATIYTGEVSAVSILDGQCAEISTGAPMPDGADAVQMVEETDSSAGGEVAMFGEVQPGQNVGARGADIRTGQVVVASGETLNSSRIGALAAIGISSVGVYHRPRVAILSTGNEIVEPGQELLPGQIYDINRFTISAVVSENGGVPVDIPRRRIRSRRLVETLDSLATHDIVVFSGGSSVGERDLIRDAITARGPPPVSWRCGEARQTHRSRRREWQTGIRHARVPDLVSVECAHASGADAAPHRATESEDQQHGPHTARAAHRVCSGTASVLYGAD
jgi:molybdopterin biosynthesis enzyme